MIKLLKKYKSKILYLLFVCFAFFYFVPAEKKHYVESDFQDFSKKSFWTLLLVVELIFLTRVLIVCAKLLPEVNKSIKDFGLFLLMLAYNGVMIFIFYFLLRDFFAATALLVNRQKVTKEIKVSYTVELKETHGDNNYKLDVYPISRQQTNNIETIIVSKEQYSEVNNGDTIEIVLKKGWLGVNFPVYEGKFSNQQK